MRRLLRWVACLGTIICGALPLPGMQVNGVAYTDLREIAARLGMNTRWIEKGERLQLHSNWTEMEFEVHRREMFLNGNLLFLGAPVAESKGRLYLSEADYINLIVPILTPQQLANIPSLGHILIDPGHGGDDPGAENRAIGLREKSLVLDLSKRLERKLEASGFKVTLTRRHDRFIPLPERSQIANRAGADLFISLHFNASGKTSVSGVETYVFTAQNQPSTSRSELVDDDHQWHVSYDSLPWGTLAGYYVQRSLVEKLTAPDRGLKRARFVVLRDLDMPGMLIEGGFVSHDKEGRNIGSAAYRDRIADAILEGVLVYQKTLSRLRASQP